ncbi:hypothetical protein [uncultured Clostridium sp.]|uniref:hypothetical protein n=1 Tax=uncultured Clostridium sp. TaxID=59620 RepID=UPI00261640F5|nr:hypothetical protein [uncultured Clostridium sp.]
MLTMHEFDEYLGSCILCDDSETKEEYIANNACDDDEAKKLASDWDFVCEEYQEYLNTYEKKIGSNLNYNSDEAICRFCGHENKLDDSDIYYENDGTFECRNCYKENEYEIQMEHEYADSYEIKTIRPNCKNKSDHLWIKQEKDDYTLRGSLRENKFPHVDAIEYICIHCGESKYIPIDENNKEFSNNSIKKLKRKYKTGFRKHKNKMIIHYDVNDSYIQITNKDFELIEDRIGTIMRTFRKSLKTKYIYNSRQEEFIFDIPNSDKKIRIWDKYYRTLIYYNDLVTRHEQLFFRTIILKLKKCMAKYGVEFIECEKSERTRTADHEFLNKEVLVRDYIRGKIIFRGIVTQFDDWYTLKIKGKYQDTIIEANEKRVELYNPNIIKCTLDKDERIGRALNKLREHSENWEFLKAQNIKVYLDRIGYKRK